MTDYGSSGISVGVILSQKPQMWRPIPIVVAPRLELNIRISLTFQLCGATIAIVRGYSPIVVSGIVDAATTFAIRAQDRLSPRANETQTKTNVRQYAGGDDNRVLSATTAASAT